MSSLGQATLERCLFKVEDKAELDQEGPQNKKIKKEPGQPAAAPPPAVADPPKGPPGKNKVTLADLSKDKALYNKFNFRLRQCEDSVKEIWKKKGNLEPEQVESFIAVVLESAKGNVDKSQFEEWEILGEVEEHGTEGSWMSWEAAAKQEGEEALLEMVRAGTVASRPHPKLPPESSIQWPQEPAGGIGQGDLVQEGEAQQGLNHLPQEEAHRGPGQGLQGEGVPAHHQQQQQHHHQETRGGAEGEG